MKFKQKAEEKKMSMSKNIARLAVTAGLTAALSFGGVMAPVTMAFAEGSTVTFEDSRYGTSSTYKGIQIFKAKVTKDNGTTKVSGIEWAGTEIQTAVVNAIKAKEKTYSSNNAQDAADWLNANAGVTGADSKVASDNVLSLIADNLDGVSGWKTTNAGDPSLSGLDAGYWLFLTNGVDNTAADKSTDTFSSPVYAVIDGQNDMTVTPKKDVPTVEKKIVNATGDKELDASDSHVEQKVKFNLYGTVADNYDTYGTYFYKFSDQLSEGLTLEDGFKATLYANKGLAQADINHTGGLDVTSSFIPSPKTVDQETKNTTMTWECEDLKKVAGVKPGSCIVISYEAKINHKAAIGDNAGNANSVTLEYSNNPMTSDTGTTVPDEVKTYTYGLKLNKVDLGTENPLPGAKFTIKVKEAADHNLVGKYVQSNGALKEKEEVITTDDKGTITVGGLGAGTYTVTEIDAPENYDKVASFDFTIKPKNESGTTGESSSAGKYELNAPSDQVIIGTPNDKKGDNKLEAKNGTATNGDGTFNITVGDTKHVGLPLTGLNGVTFTWIAGGAVLVIGVAHLIRSRKQAEESEQE